MNGSEFYEFVLDALSKNFTFRMNGYCGGIKIVELKKKCENVRVTLTEYRRLYNLFKSLGVDVDSEDFIDSFECDDFEMLAEWMNFHRNNNTEMDSKILEAMHKYSDKFDINMLEMFKYMMNDENGEYLNAVMEFILHAEWYDSHNDTDEEVWSKDSKGKEFSFKIGDIWDHIDGFLIDFVSLSWDCFQEFVCMLRPGTLLDEKEGKEILRKFWGNSV